MQPSFSNHSDTSYYLTLIQLSIVMFKVGAVLTVGCVVVVAASVVGCVVVVAASVVVVAGRVVGLDNGGGGRVVQLVVQVNFLRGACIVKFFGNKI